MSEMIYRVTPTARQRAVAKYLLEGEEKTLFGAMVKAGYSVTTASRPQQLTQTRGWQQIMDEALNDELLSEVHTSLLKSKRLEHMVFPLYTGDEDPDTEVLPGTTLEPQPHGGALKRERAPTDRSTLTDDDIADMLADVGGTVRRIVHGETARHVYFWAANDKARQDALKLAYDVKGKLKANGTPDGSQTTYNTFLQQNNINPNTPSAQALVQASLDALMASTKRKVVDV